MLTTGIHKYTAVPAPSLVILAIPHDQGTWVDNSADLAVREAAKAYSNEADVLREMRASLSGLSLR